MWLSIFTRVSNITSKNASAYSSVIIKPNTSITARINCRLIKNLLNRVCFILYRLL